MVLGFFRKRNQRETALRAVDRWLSEKDAEDPAFTLYDEFMLSGMGNCFVVVGVCNMEGRYTGFCAEVDPEIGLVMGSKIDKRVATKNKIYAQQARDDVQSFRMPASLCNILKESSKEIGAEPIEI